MAYHQIANAWIEVFWVGKELAVALTQSGDWKFDGHETVEPGWYYWFCFPGCLPDTGASGPFNDPAKTLEAARREWEVEA